MGTTTAVLNGIIHGRTIELDEAPGLPEGQKVHVQLEPSEEIPKWLNCFSVDPAIAVGKLLVKGTKLLAEDLAQEISNGQSDDGLRQLHPELSEDDVAALHQYVRVPEVQRRLFGAWAENADELDLFLAELRRHRTLPRRRFA